MRFRKLRIAFSVLCVIACLLLIVLWVRSHKCVEAIGGTYHGKYFALESREGQCAVCLFDQLEDQEWYIDYLPIEQFTTQPQGPSGIQYLPGGGIISLLHWLLILFWAFLIAISWLPVWSKRFSLRTLLTATTLVAVALGFVAYIANH